MEPERGHEGPELPRPTLWPIGFAIGVVCLLVGLVVSWPAVGVGAAIAIIFGFVWIRDMQGHHKVEPPAAIPAAPVPAESYSRGRFLGASTLGLGAVIGGAISVPAIGFAIVPPFLKQGRGELDLGPISDYQEQQWYIVHFELDPAEGEVTRRTAYIRYNGLVPFNGKSEPSFTIISNRCAHLGCPVQPNGLVSNQAKDENTGNGQMVQLIQVQGLSGFGCPCHGGAYDTEGNRTAGPPVRGLDRYQFAIRKGHLFLGKAYSVKKVEGTGGTAKIREFNLTGPGQHVGDWEALLYPLQPPH